MDRFTWTFVAGAIALCVLAIASVFLVRAAPRPSPSTPAGVVTSFIEAVRDREADRAWAQLAPDAVVGSIPPPLSSGTDKHDQFRQQMANLSQDGSGGRRLRITDVSENGTNARVTVEVSQTNGPPLFGGTDVRTLTFTLKQVDGAWKINSTPSLFEIG
jgi:ketosteroid isomerase-like protein